MPPVADPVGRLRRFLELQTGVRRAVVSRSRRGAPIEAAVEIVDTASGLPARRIPGGWTVTELNPHETDYLYREIFVDRAYAPPELVLPPRPLILDVGASIGMYCLFLSTWATDARVIAFEPSPDGFAALSANLTDLALPVTALPWAVGAADGTRSMTIYPSASV